MTKSEARTRYFALLEKAVRVLAHLPSVAAYAEAFDNGDEAMKADIALLLNEFARIDGEMAAISEAMRCLH